MKAGYGFRPEGRAIGGTTSPGAKLVVSGGDAAVTTQGNGVILIGSAQTRAFIAGIRGKTTGNANAVTVMIDSAGQLGTVSSSRRYKEDIEDMAGASDSLLSLRPVTFRYKKAFADGDKPIQYGLIAEEVFPDLVVYNEDGEPETVKYHLMTTLLLNEFQKQKQEHEKEIAALKTTQEQEIAALKTMMQQMGQQMATLVQEVKIIQAAASKAVEPVYAQTTAFTQ